MNKETLFESIGHIDDGLIMRSEQRKHLTGHKLALAMACVVFLALGISLRLALPTNDVAESAPAQQENNEIELDESYGQYMLAWEYVDAAPVISDNASMRHTILDEKKKLDVRGYVYVDEVNEQAVVWLGYDGEGIVLDQEVVGLDMVEDAKRELEKRYLDAINAQGED